MSALPSEDPQRQRAPDREAAPKPKRNAPAPSSYRRPRGVPRKKPATVVKLPEGHRAILEKNPTSVGFLGGAFSMDSLEFLKWMAVYFHDDIACLRSLLYLMGSQEPGGTIRATQKEIAHALQLNRVHVNRAIGRLFALGLVHMVQRGLYQLNPQVVLRGGTIEVEEPGRSSTRKPATRRVDQLELIEELAEDPAVPEEFTQLMLPNRAPKKPRASEG
ncbi:MULTISPECIES: helix-turn-helix domain-containing protein [unclassified Streptomyces]|uniref:helix-turn-helix domain-containing protein n=1 Tax=unclassified Streptomyces TaxID=2593676 RepID=UPI001EEFD3AF|nr:MULTISPECIES: helix-turn-helix domain-containing protein [unclassified Streptomyces]